MMIESAPVSLLATKTLSTLALTTMQSTRRLAHFVTRRLASSLPPYITSTPPLTGFTGAVGNTPLIRLPRLSKETGCDILGKAEFQNPGGSVKDRAALYLIRDAEEKGMIKPGGTVVEGTAGNTGIAAAMIARSKGYRCVIYMPNTQSQEKMDLLRMLGAEVFPVPAVAFTDPENYNHQAARHAQGLDNAVWLNQFDNIANRRAHIETTGPEIWNQTKDIPSSKFLKPGLHGFICSTGTGGTLAGTSKYLHDVSHSSVKCFLADPPGSVLYHYITSKGEKLERKGDSSITEGIGQGRITSNLKNEVENGLIHDAIHVTDEESIEMVYRLLDEEGIYVGASSALNVVAAVQMAKQLGPGHRIVTIICDGAAKYQSRLFSKSWLESKNLYSAIPEHLRKYASLK